MNLSKLNTVLAKKLGKDWHLLEIETLSLEIGALFDDITLVKMAVLKSILAHPDIILNDAEYFLRFIEVANNNVPDPHHHDIPTSLELIWAIHELWSILGKDNVKVNGCLSNATRYIINNEGHGEAYHNCLSVYSGYPLATNAKTKAGDEYISSMQGGI